MAQKETSEEKALTMSGSSRYYLPFGKHTKAKAIEHGPFVVDLPIKNGDSP